MPETRETPLDEGDPRSLQELRIRSAAAHEPSLLHRLGFDPAPTRGTLRVLLPDRSPIRAPLPLALLRGVQA